ncbi:MAG: hypothetical protein HQK54_14430, partial [Oligoflexales bacterium]|nr:hypothetical protein [Oligoflexales bacterium]
IKSFQTVLASKFPLERNQARYRIGVCHNRMEKFSMALPMFEQVVRDDTLKEEEGSAEISLEKRAVSKNLKREALIDSIISYTHLYRENPDPVTYYSNLAPTEALYQEVIEKLAFRYIQLKKYGVAVMLLRKLGERTADPQKIVNIYREVLSMIPINDRIDLKIEEMRYVLEKYGLWLSYYNIPHKTRTTAYKFIETQVRELGTASHDIAKKLKDQEKLDYYLERATDFYELYLGFFKNSPNKTKMALNLADVEYRRKNYLKSGDMYLRIFEGEFGPPQNRREVIENAIMILQKEAEYDFYETLRARGLLISSVRSYMEFDKKQQGNADLNFILAKAQYDQGAYGVGLPALLNYMEKFPGSKHAVDAGEVIMDYFNIRKDYGGLYLWTGKILALKPRDQKFADKVSKIRNQANMMMLEEKVKSLDNYDAFAQGQGYLEVARSSSDPAIMSAALSQALSRSKQESDYKTFFESAKILAEKENAPDKKGNILDSIAKENLAITRFIASQESFEQIYDNSSMSLELRKKSFEDSVNLAILMRDWKRLKDLIGKSNFSIVSPGTRKNLKNGLLSAVTSPVNLPEGLVKWLSENQLSERDLSAVYKLKSRYDLSDFENGVKARCRKSKNLPVCKWARLVEVDSLRKTFLEKISSAPLSPEGIEKVASQFLPLTNAYQELSDSGDMHLEIIINIRNHELYSGFAEYLDRVGDSRRELRDVLKAKSAESMKAARNYLAACHKIAEKSQAINPAVKHCNGHGTPNLSSLVMWKEYMTPLYPSADPAGTSINNMRRSLFANRKDAQKMMDVASSYYEQKEYNFAAAAATYGLSWYKAQQDDFRVILGCSVLHLGLLEEANFHLKKASSASAKDLQEKCLVKLKLMVST